MAFLMQILVDAFIKNIFVLKVKAKEEVGEQFFGMLEKYVSHFS